ncbi:MAG: response regulator transcription factor [Gallionellaceae bacterium]|jgi:DNA-binding NarL/FixJ family response regulator
MIRVLIADDHAVVRQGLKMIFALCPDIEVLAEAVDGDGIIQHLRGTTDFNLLLMDMNMPGVSGIGLIERIKMCRKTLPILVFSMQNDPHIVVRALKSGASGYIAKDKDPAILLEAIRKVADGGKYIDPVVAEQMVFEGLSNEQSVPHAHLSDRELEVFRLLVVGKGVNEIADQLIISNKTVSSHKKRLMEKMHFSGMADLMRYAVQRRLFDDVNQG